MDRSGADLLCLNSADDLALYDRGRKALGLDSSNAVVTGLPILWQTKPRTSAPENPSIVFFEQPSIPVHPLQRRFLCDQIKELAGLADHPVIKTAHIKHREHPASEPRGNGQRDRQNDARAAESAPEFQARHTPAAAVWLRHHRLVDGRHESMAMGISTCIVGDLGVTETLGNHFFASSGAIATFAAIKANPST